MADENLNGQAIADEVSAEYPEDFPQERFQEEVLVRGLTKMVLVSEKTPQVDNWVKKVLYQIKQALRKLIGKKVNVSKMNGDTTMKQLADMLISGDVVELQKEMTTGTDIIEYFKAEQEFIDKFDELNKSEDANEMTQVQDMIDNVFRIALEQREDILNNPEFFSLQEAFINEFNTGVLDDIRNILGKDTLISQNDIVSHIAETNENNEYVMNIEKVRQRMNNLTHTLYKMSDMMDTIDSQLDEISDMDSKDKIDRLVYYKKFNQSWGEQIDTFFAMSIGEDPNNPMKKLANTLKDKLAKNTAKIQKVQNAALEDVFVELMERPAANALEQFEADVQRKKNAPQAVRDRMYREFHNMTEAEYKRYKELKSKGKKTREYKDLHEKWLLGLEFDRDKAKAILAGETVDSNYFNSMLESVSMNTDPAISSVYKHIQDLTTKYETEALAYYADFMDTVLPHIEKNGKDYQNRGALGRKLGFKDTKGVLKSDGTVEQVEEWTFLNPWQNYRYDQAVLKSNISQAAEAFRESNSDADKTAWEEAKREHQLWKNRYMNQDYAVEYYEALDLLQKDDIVHVVMEGIYGC